MSLLKLTGEHQKAWEAAAESQPANSLEQTQQK